MSGGARRTTRLIAAFAAAASLLAVPAAPADANHTPDRPGSTFSANITTLTLAYDGTHTNTWRCGRSSCVWGSEIAARNATITKTCKVAYGTTNPNCDGQGHNAPAGSGLVWLSDPANHTTTWPTPSTYQLAVCARDLGAGANKTIVDANGHAAGGQFCGTWTSPDTVCATAGEHAHGSGACQRDHAPPDCSLPIHHGQTLSYTGHNSAGADETLSVACGTPDPAPTPTPPPATTTPQQSTPHACAGKDPLDVEALLSYETANNPYTNTGPPGGAIAYTDRFAAPVALGRSEHLAWEQARLRNRFYGETELTAGGDGDDSNDGEFVYTVSAGWNYLPYSNHLYYQNYPTPHRSPFNTGYGGWVTSTLARAGVRGCGLVQSRPNQISLVATGGTFGCKHVPAAYADGAYTVSATQTTDLGVPSRTRSLPASYRRSASITPSCPSGQTPVVLPAEDAARITVTSTVTWTVRVIMYSSTGWTTPSSGGGSGCASHQRRCWTLSDTEAKTRFASVDLPAPSRRGF